MILVDTSVWIDHLRQSEPQMVELLTTGNVLIHSFVVGELACGNLSARQKILGLLNNLPKSKQANDEEVLYFVENNQLMGKGIGYIDAHLLASTALNNDAKLWTRDKRLAKLADSLGLGFN